MNKKKEILKKISNKEISHMREIDEKYQLDEDVLQLFMKTFYDFKELNEKEKEIKTKELVDKAKNKILEQREYKFLKDKSDGKLTKKEKFQYFEMKTEIKQLEQEMETFKYLKNQSINTKIQNEEIEKDIKRQKMILEVSKNPKKLLNYPDNVRLDQDILIEVLTLELNAYPYIHENLKNNEDFNMKLLSKCINVYKFLSKIMQKADSIVKCAILIDDNAKFIKFASKKVRDDAYAVTKAILTDHSLIKYVSPRLIKDRKYNLKILKEKNSFYSFLDKNFKNDRSFIIDWVRKSPSGIDVLEPQMKKSVQGYLNAMGDSDDLNTADPKVLGDLDIIDKSVVLKFLNKIIIYSYEYEYENAEPSFIKYLHKSLLKDKDIFACYLRFKELDKNILQKFDKGLFKAFKNKNFQIEYTITSWNGLPAQTSIFYDTDIAETNDDGSYDAQANSIGTNPVRAFAPNYYYSIINNVFSLFKFKDKTQNKYFNNRNALPVRGFPTFVYHWGMDNKYSHINLVECDLDDNDEDDEGYVEKPYEYSYENDRIYEKRKKDDKLKGEEWGFDTFDYLKLEYFLNFIVDLEWVLYRHYDCQGFWKKINKKIIYNRDVKEFEKFLYKYAQIIVNTQNLKSQSSLGKSFIKQFNQQYKKQKITLLNMVFNENEDHSETSRDTYPRGQMHGSFKIEFQGIDRLLKLKNINISS